MICSFALTLESRPQARNAAAGKAEAADLGSCSQTNPFKSANKLIQISFVPTKCINNAAVAAGTGQSRGTVTERG